MELLEENTGASFSRRRLTRRRESASPPAPSSSKQRNVIESSDEDLDDDNFPRVQDIHNIWDDDRAAAGRDDDDDVDMDDMYNFIEEDEEEGGAALDEQEREARRRERRRLEKARRRALGSRPELTGIDATYVSFRVTSLCEAHTLRSAWDEIHEVFGDGHDYDWALVDDEEAIFEEERAKPDMKYQDVSSICPTYDSDA